MAGRIGTLVTSPLRITDDTIPYPVAYANEVNGGAQSGITLAVRNALGTHYRNWGMFYTVYNDGANNGTYILKFGLTSQNLADNGNWVLFAGASSTGSGTKKVDIALNNKGNLIVPAGSFFQAIVANVTGTAPSAFMAGFTDLADDVIMTQPLSAGFTTFNKGIYTPTAQIIYFNGVGPATTVSLIYTTF